MIVVNALGCVESGARRVLTQLLEKYSLPERCWFIVSDDSLKRRILHPNIKIVCLDRRIFGVLLRPLVELAIGIITLLPGAKTINLSNYGFGFNKRYLIYIHSPYLLDHAISTPVKYVLQRWALNFCIARGACFVLQSVHMARAFTRYCKERNWSSIPRFTVIPPHLAVEACLNSERHFEFQLLYPASSFPHKRVGVAIDATRVAYATDPDIGLVITCKGTSADGVKCVGLIAYKRVQSLLRGSDALLFTSDRETLGLPLLEALSLGLPAILPNLDYAFEIYGGDAAVYYNDESEIPDCILKLKAHYKCYRREAQERRTQLTAGRVSWEEHWRRFEDLLKENVSVKTCG